MFATHEAHLFNIDVIDLNDSRALALVGSGGVGGGVSGDGVGGSSVNGGVGGDGVGGV